MVNNCPSNPTPDIPPDPPFDVYVVEGSDEGPGTEPGRTEADDATDTETTSKGVVEVGEQATSVWSFARAPSRKYHPPVAGGGEEGEEAV